MAATGQLGRARHERHRSGPCEACGWDYVHRHESTTGHGFCTNVQCHRSAARKEARRIRYTENSWSGSVRSRCRQSQWPDANEPQPLEPEEESATGVIDLTGAASAAQGPSRDLPVGRPLVPVPTPLLGTCPGASADGHLRRSRWAHPAGPRAMEIAPMDLADGAQMPSASPPWSARADASSSSPGSRTRAPNPSVQDDVDLANAAGREVQLRCLVHANWPRVAMMICPMSSGLMHTVVVNCECRFCLPLQNTIRAHLEANNVNFTII